MRESELEATLAWYMELNGLPRPEREFLFDGRSRGAGRRNWRFDFCWPEERLAVEVEGGVHSGGRHVTGVGFERDCAKCNEALAQGWRVLRVTGGQIEDGSAIDWIRRALGVGGGGEAAPF